MNTTSLFLIFFVFLSPFLFLFYYYLKNYELKKTNQVAQPSPPGRWGWPVIGESLDFFSSGQKGEPEKFIFRRLTKYGTTIFKTSILGERMVVMCGDKANKFLFANERKLVQSWWPSNLNKIFPSSTQTSSSDESFRVRQMLIPNFLNPDAMRQYVGAMDKITHRHFVSAWENNEVVHAFPLIKKLTLSVACYISTGMEKLSHNFEESFDVLILGLLSIPVDLPGTRFRRAIKASNQLREIMKQIIKQRKIDLAGVNQMVPMDILSHMLVTPDENGIYMKEHEIADKIIGLMVGAYEPTSSACASVVKYLAELPHIYDGVYKEQMEIAKSKRNGELLSWDDIQKMKYSWKVVCEVLRIVPPLQGAFREAMVDFTYNGFSIPKGRKIYWSANTTHRSPEFFKDPMIFDPSRFEGGGPPPYSFVPFGGGMRMCPGQEYARVEILVFIHHLVKRFRWKKVIADEKVVMYPVPVPTRGLPLRLIAHK